MSRVALVALACAAAVFAAITFFVGLPSIILEANQSEFRWPFRNIIATYLPWALGVVAIWIVPTLLMPIRVARWWAACAVVTATYIWVHGVFQTHVFGSIDGRHWSTEVPLWQVAAEGVAIVVGAAAVWVLAVRRPALSTGLMTLLTAGMLLQAWPVISDSHWDQMPTSDSRMKEVSTFSSDKNVLVILLDTLTSDVFEEMVSSTPDLKSAFDGFLSFSDTVGVAPTTYLSMPTIHSGEVYENGEVLGDFFDRAVGDNSVLTKLAEAGFQSILVNPIRGTCPREVTCFDVQAAMGGNLASLRSEANKVADSVLFRLAPLGLKQWVYNEGEWRFQQWLNDPRFVHSAVSGNVFLTEMAADVSGDAQKPSLKFVHLFTTHPPYMFEGECEYTGRALKVVRSNFDLQASCSLRKLARLLNALKAQNLYDNTAIMVIADHGNYQFPSSRTTATGAWATRIASANPTFALKPFGSKGEFRRVEGEVHIGDFGATLCDITKVCQAKIGVSALAAPSEGRLRVFNDYRWKHEYWDAELLPDLKRVELMGPVGDIESGWGTLAVAKIDETISFNNQGSSGRYTLSGWSRAESWGTWTDGQSASLWFRTEEERPRMLTINGQGFASSGNPMLIKVVIDGREVGEMLFPTRDAREERFDIPGDAIADGDIKIEFIVPKPLSPKDVGLSNDSRKLGLGLHWLRLDH